MGQLNLKELCAAGLLAGLVIFGGCTPGFIPGDGQQHQLTIDVRGEGTVDPEGGEFNGGSILLLVATPAEGWRFVRWEGDSIGINSRTLIRLTGDMSVTAVFRTIDEYTLGVTIEGQGTVDPPGGTFSVNESVSMTATPAEGWRFLRWRGDIENTDPTAQIVMTESKAIIAEFVPEDAQNTVNVTVQGQGNVEPFGGAFRTGETITLTATPVEGWRFLGWSRDIQSNELATEITITEDMEVTAMFVPENDNPKVRMETSKGTMVIELDRVHAPITVDNFLRYVVDGFFDGRDGKGATIFHRVMPGFMVQGGGFTVEMEQKTTREQIAIESNNGLTNDRGTIAMARTNDPNSATSQFFVNVVDNDFLNYSSPDSPGYAVFGRVIEGMETADAIVEVQTHTVEQHENVPVEPITIISAELVTE